jgi:hypothetical protein
MWLCSVGGATAVVVAFVQDWHSRWEVACVIVTVGTLFPLPRIIQRFLESAAKVSGNYIVSQEGVRKRLMW